MTKFRLYVLSVALFLGACGNDGVLVTTEFANTQDVKKGTSVYFGRDVVGVVHDISLTENGSVVQLEFDKELVISIDSKAAVVVNRLREGAPLEVHNPAGAVRRPIESGQNLEGLDSMVQLVGWGIGSSIDAGAETLSAFSDYLKSDGFKQDKAKVGVAIDNGLSAAKSGFRDAERELERTIAEINISEEELAVVIQELGEEMGPMVTELASSGTELLFELERFADKLESSSLEDQRSGEKFFNSLNHALEALSERFNEGVEQGLNSSESEIDPNN